MTYAINGLTLWLLMISQLRSMISLEVGFSFGVSTVLIRFFQGKRIDFLFLCFIAITMHIDLISVSLFALNIAYTLYPCFAYWTTSHS